MEVTLIKNEVKNQYNFKISKQYLTILNSIYPSFYINNLLKENVLEYEIDLFDFKYLFDNIIYKADLAIKYSNSTKSKSEVLNNIFLENKNNYLKIRGDIPYNLNELSHNRKNLIDKLLDKLINQNIDKVNPFLDCTLDLLNSDKQINKLNDLIKAKDNILENLKRICDENEFKNISNQYNILIKNCDSKNLERLLLESQQKILNHWHQFITDPNDFIPGKPFYFICHSLINADIEGDFTSNFVSCSLLTDKLTDTYHSGYGFILPTDYIVGACSEDMYIDNQAGCLENLSNSTTIPEINIPEIIIEKALKQKEENRKNHEKKKVYTEVVSSKFEPIGIFCLTNGSKKLNYNYNCALKLKEKYPELQIKEIDLTLYKDDLTYEKEKLINEIEKILTKTYPNNIDYNRYNWFWDKYLELKKNTNYTEEDIINLYKQNKDFLSVFIDFDNIFDNYDIKTVRYILLNNYKTNLKNIFDGTFKSWNLKNLYDTLKTNNKDKLNEAFKGLGNFIEIFSKVDINDEVITKIKQEKKFDFTYLNQILLKEIKYQKQTNLNKLNELKKQLENLKKDKIDKEIIIEKISNCNNFINNSYLYFIATNDIKDEENKITLEESAKQFLNIKLENLETSLNIKEIELKKAQKIKIFNLSKIKKIKEEINNLTNQKEKIKQDILNKDKEIIISKNNITSYQQKFKQEVGCDLDNYLELKNQATDFILKQSLYLYQFELTEIINNIEKIKNQIKNLNKELGILEEIQIQNKK